MENFLLYILKSSLIITAVFLLYQLLKNDKYFIRNRIYLVIGLLFSLVLPLITFTPSQPIAILKPFTLEPVIINAKQVNAIVQQNFNIFWIIMIVYFLGIIIFLIRDVLQIYKLMSIAKKSGIVGKNGYKLVFTKDAGSPFSFFNMIFINKQIDINEAETILVHEQTHVKQQHSLDVILMEIVVVLQWFNPIAWYYRTLIREVHEYLADSATLKNGIEKAGYLQLLFAMALKVKPADISNSFCQIKLKRRLSMISKKCNSRFSGLKFILSISLLIMFLWVVSCESSDKNKAISNGSLPAVPPSTSASMNNDKALATAEKMPSYQGGDKALVKFIMDNIKYPQAAKEKGVMGTVYISFVIETDGTVSDAKVDKGIGSGCDEEALRVVKLMPKWIPGQDAGKNISVSLKLPVKFSLN